MSESSNQSGSQSVGSQSVKGTQIGVVESDVRSKSRTVVVGYFSKHPKYGKYIRQKTVLQVHDENNESRKGDRVEVMQCRPMSKTKTWKLLRVVERRAEVTAALDSAKAVSEQAN
jgi:small subunit ribosomal protein S17